MFYMKYLLIALLFTTGCITKNNQKTLIHPHSKQIIEQDHSKVYKLMKIYGIKDLKID
jgi:hypothetical protein